MSFNELPNNFYKAMGKKVPQQRPVQKVPPKNTPKPVAPAAHPDLPQNFYKFNQATRPQPQSSTSRSVQQPVRAAQHPVVPAAPPATPVSGPSDLDMFTIEQRLRRMKTTKKKGAIASVNQLEKRLDKLAGADKNINLNELEERLEGLKDGKRRKMTPLVRVYSTAEDAEEIVNTVQKEAGIGAHVFPKQHGTNPTSMMTPEELLVMIRKEVDLNPEAATESDSTHDDFSSDVGSELSSSESDLISEDDDNSLTAEEARKAVRKRKEKERQEWKRVAKEMIKQAELEAKIKKDGDQRMDDAESSLKDLDDTMKHVYK